MVRYFKAGTTVIRAYNFIAVLAAYPAAKQISREDAAKHDASGGAITWILD